MTNDPSLTRKIAGGVIALIGIGILVLTLANQLFSRAPDYEALVDDFRPVFTDEAVGALRADLAGLDAAAAEFGTVVVPTIAGATSTDPADVVTLLGEQFPDVVQGLAIVPALTEQFGGLADLVESQESNFESADAIPTSSIPASSIPWLLIAIGILILLAGAALVMRPNAKLALAACGIGAVVVLALLVLSLPGKASDADELNAAVAPLFEPATVEAANAGLGAVGAMAVQLQGEAIPAIGEMLAVPPDQLEATVASQFPDTATALAGLPDASARFGGLIGLIDTNRDRYDNIEKVDFSQVINLTLLGAALTAVVGFGAAVGGRKSDPQPVNEKN